MTFHNVFSTPTIKALEYSACVPGMYIHQRLCVSALGQMTKQRTSRTESGCALFYFGGWIQLSQ